GPSRDEDFFWSQKDLTVEPGAQLQLLLEHLCRNDEITPPRILFARHVDLSKDDRFAVCFLKSRCRDSGGSLPSYRSFKFKTFGMNDDRRYDLSIVQFEQFWGPMDTDMERTDNLVTLVNVFHDGIKMNLLFLVDPNGQVCADGCFRHSLPEWDIFQL